jgi:glutaminyl-tRNA synthetase
MNSPKEAAAPASNFLRHIVERDLEAGTYAARTFAGTPGDARHHAGAPPDPARIRTRFPPEPNGYLHIGHAKSITLNFGLAQEYGGICHLRFDDTNPEKEEQEYVDAIIDAVRWLGFDWHAPEPALAGEPGDPARPQEATTSHLYFASDYFDFMYRAAEALVDAGLAYVDEQSADEIRARRGDFATPGQDSPFRDRTPAENLARLRQMKAGELTDGAAVLRARLDMTSPNINLRDPVIYRIKRATHHNTGDRWCIYPMYAYAHPIEDALENITHSICTLEFEDQRPWYDWLLDKLCELGLLAQPRPHQYEFARLNVTYVITSKRKLKALVDERIVAGWDDPRMPTIAGLRRRGYTPEALRLMCERAGTSKAGGWTEYASLDAALRDDLDPKAPRAMAVLDPVELRLTNWAALFGSEAHREACHAPVHPQKPELGERRFLARAAAMDRARRLRRGAGQGVLPPLPRQPGAPQVRLRHRVQRLREGRRGTGHRGARQRRARHQERHAGRGCDQGQGHDHLGRRRRLRSGRGAPLRPALQRSPARCRRQGLQGEPQSRQPAHRHRIRRSGARECRGRAAVPDRAPRLLRHRAARPCARQAGAEPDRAAARNLDPEVTRLAPLPAMTHPFPARRMHLALAGTLVAALPLVAVAQTPAAAASGRRRDDAERPDLHRAGRRQGAEPDRGRHGPRCTIAARSSMAASSTAPTRATRPQPFPSAASFRAGPKACRR